MSKYITGWRNRSTGKICGNESFDRERSMGLCGWIEVKT